MLAVKNFELHWYLTAKATDVPKITTGFMSQGFIPGDADVIEWRLILASWKVKFWNWQVSC